MGLSDFMVSLLIVSIYKTFLRPSFPTLKRAVALRQRRFCPPAGLGHRTAEDRETRAPFPFKKNPPRGEPMNGFPTRRISTFDDSRNLLASQAPYAETNSRRLFAAFAVDTLTEETGFAGLGEVSLTRASRFSLPAN